MLHASLFIGHTPKKGRGVFTAANIAEKTVIEIAPVLVVNAAERALLEQTLLYNYIFSWGENETEAAVGLGYSSMYNHASPSNCEYVMNFSDLTITIITMRAIAPGEELTINYSTHWDEQKPVWFEEAGDD
jgi:uncharacterized protein